jgi:hypothetical protein
LAAAADADFWPGELNYLVEPREQSDPEFGDCMYMASHLYLSLSLSIVNSHRCIRSKAVAADYALFQFQHRSSAIAASWLHDRLCLNGVRRLNSFHSVHVAR